MSATKPRLAVIGATRGFSLVKGWLEAHFCQMAALCDLNTDLCNQNAQTLVAAGMTPPRIFNSIDDLIDWGQFDAVIIATPDQTHFQIAQQCFEAGFHCYIEKPMTNTIEDAQKLVQTWKKSQCIGVVGHEFRYTEAVKRAKETIDAGTIGQPRLITTMDSCGRMGSYWRRKEWRDDKKHPANSLTLQKAIHQLDLQTYLMGSTPRSVYATAGQNHYGGKQPIGLTCAQCDKTDTCLYYAENAHCNGRPCPSFTRDQLCVYGTDVNIHDNLIAAIDYDNGARSSYIECFFTPDYRFEIQIIGDLGRIRINYYFGNPYIEFELSFIGGPSAYNRELIAGGTSSHGGGDYLIGQQFCQAVIDKKQIQPDIIDGFNSIALACAIDTSAHTQTRQDITTAFHSAQ